MPAKKVVTWFLLAIVAAGFVFAVVRTASEHGSSVAEKSDSGYKSLSDKPVPRPLAELVEKNTDVVCYFMNSQRCSNCYKIEAYTKQAVDDNFSGEIENGSLSWIIINVDEPENRRYIEDYGLYTKSVVLVRVRDGKEAEWKNLDQVWSLLGNKDRFQAYITDEVGSFLENG